MVKKICEKKGNIGDFSVSFLVILMFCIALLVLIVSFLGAFTSISKVNTMANEIMRISEIKGHTGIDNEVNRIVNASGLDDVTVSFDCDYISGTNRVQLGGNMAVVIATKSTVGIGRIVKIDVPIKGKAVGISEQYWK